MVYSEITKQEFLWANFEQGCTPWKRESTGLRYTWKAHSPVVDIVNRFHGMTREKAEGVLIARRSLNRPGWLSTIDVTATRMTQQWKICGFLIADVFQLSIAHSLPSSYYHRTHSSRRRWPFSTSRQFSPLFTRSCTTKYSLVDNPFSKNAALCVETASIALPKRKHVYVVPLVELSTISRRVSTAEDKNNACNLGRCETVWPLSTSKPPPLLLSP